jgi:hypothetical protein
LIVFSVGWIEDILTWHAVNKRSAHMQRPITRNQRITPSKRRSVARSSSPLDESTVRAIREVKKTNDGHSIAFHDKLAALNSIARILGMDGKIEHPGIILLMIFENETLWVRLQLNLGNALVSIYVRRARRGLGKPETLSLLGLVHLRMIAPGRFALRRKFRGDAGGRAERSAPRAGNARSSSAVALLGPRRSQRYATAWHAALWGVSALPASNRLPAAAMLGRVEVAFQARLALFAALSDVGVATPEPTAQSLPPYRPVRDEAPASPATQKARPNRSTSETSRSGSQGINKTVLA